MTWRHWLLLGRLARKEVVTGDLCDLHDLESNGYAFNDNGGRWCSTSEGVRAHDKQLTMAPSWPRSGTGRGGPESISCGQCDPCKQCDPFDCWNPQAPAI
jgi:hypothetical protein